MSTVDQKSSVANIAFNSMRQPTQGAGQGLGLGVLSNTDNIINSSRRATIGIATTSSASDQATAAARMASTNIPMSRPTGALSSSLVLSSSITSLLSNSSSVRVTIISLSSDCHVFDALSYSTFLCSAVLSRPVLNWIGLYCSVLYGVVSFFCDVLHCAVHYLFIIIVAAAAMSTPLNITII